MSKRDLSRRDVVRMLGDEAFRSAGDASGFTLLDFWSWSSSDLLNNALRGVLAEFLVGHALGVVEKPRIEWDFYDLTTAGGAKVEVKSSAYLQSWDQDDFSKVEFDIEPKTPDASRPELGTERRRQADVYVFALLKHKNKDEVDPLDIDQWDFYILPTATLDREKGGQKKIRLAPLLQLNPAYASYDQLTAVIERVFPDPSRSQAEDRAQTTAT